MKRIFVAEYRGQRGNGLPFIIGQTYPIAVTKRFWSKRIEVYKTRGYLNHAQEGTEHSFNNIDEFNKCWEIKEEVDE